MSSLMLDSPHLPHLLCMLCSVGLSWECLLTSNSFCICNKVEYCCKSLSKVDCFQGKADALVKSQVASPWLKRVTETLTTKTHTRTPVQKGEGGKQNGAQKKLPRLEDGYFCRARVLLSSSRAIVCWCALSLSWSPTCYATVCVFSVCACVCVCASMIDAQFARDFVLMPLTNPLAQSVEWQSGPRWACCTTGAQSKRRERGKEERWQREVGGNVAKS